MSVIDEEDALAPPSVDDDFENVENFEDLAHQLDNLLDSDKHGLIFWGELMMNTGNLFGGEISSDFERRDERDAVAPTNVIKNALRFLADNDVEYKFACFSLVHRRAILFISYMIYFMAPLTNMEQTVRIYSQKFAALSGDFFKTLKKTPISVIKEAIKNVIHGMTQGNAILQTQMTEFFYNDDAITNSIDSLGDTPITKQLESPSRRPVIVVDFTKIYGDSNFFQYTVNTTSGKNVNLHAFSKTPKYASDVTKGIINLFLTKESNRNSLGEVNSNFLDDLSFIEYMQTTVDSLEILLNHIYDCWKWTLQDLSPSMTFSEFKLRTLAEIFEFDETGGLYAEDDVPFPEFCYDIFDVFNNPDQSRLLKLQYKYTCNLYFLDEQIDNIDVWFSDGTKSSSIPMYLNMFDMHNNQPLNNLNGLQCNLLLLNKYRTGTPTADELFEIYNIIPHANNVVSKFDQYLNISKSSGAMFIGLFAKIILENTTDTDVDEVMSQPPTLNNNNTDIPAYFSVKLKTIQHPVIIPYGFNFYEYDESASNQQETAESTDDSIIKCGTISKDFIDQMKSANSNVVTTNI